MTRSGLKTKRIKNMPVQVNVSYELSLGLMKFSNSILSGLFKLPIDLILL